MAGCKQASARPASAIGGALAGRPPVHNQYVPRQWCALQTGGFKCHLFTTRGGPPRNGYAVFFFRPALTFLFVDSGSEDGLKDASRAILFSSDSSLRMVGTIAHLCGCPAAHFLR